MTSKWWLSSKLKLGTVLKKILKLVNYMKIDFVFVLNLNIFIRKKRQKNARFMDNAFKNKGHYIFQC